MERAHLRPPTSEESRAIMQQMDKFDAPADMEEAIERHREHIEE